jgi:hypothetical protein
MMQRFENMHTKMMENFFGKGNDDLNVGSMLDDPFFKDSGFGRMDSMFSDAN